MASCGGVETIIFNCSSSGGEETILDTLMMVVRIFSVGMGMLAIIGITICGIIYLTAGGNENRALMAKKRMGQIAIGLVLFVCLFGIAKFLSPGTAEVLEQYAGDPATGGSSESETGTPAYDPQTYSASEPTGSEGWVDEQN